MAAGLRASLTTASATSEFMQRVGPIEYPRQVVAWGFGEFQHGVVQIFLYEESETQVLIEKVCEKYTEPAVLMQPSVKAVGYMQLRLRW